MRVYILLLLPLLLGATSLDTLIANAKNKHTSLKAIQHKLDALDHEYEASQNFSNPVVSLSVSDIQLNDISNRSIEPMQYSAINITQKIPYFGKRDALGDKIDVKKEQVAQNLQEAKVKLVKRVKTTAYTIWQVEEDIKLTDENIKLIKQIIDLKTAYSNNDPKYNMGVIAAQLNLSQLKIKKHKLESIKEGLYKQISYLSETDVKSLELNMQIKEPKTLSHYQTAIANNNKLKIKESEVSEAQADLKIKELSSYVDPSIQLGYFHRESFEDYINVGISFSLPIYGTERSQEEASRKLFLATKSEMDDLHNALNAELEETYAKLQYAYKEYSILNNESLEQLNQMFVLIDSSIIVGSDLFAYIELLQKKLLLQEQNIDAITSYYKTLAALEAMTGEM